MTPEPAFGLDLSGYSGEGSSLAELRQGVSEGYLATVYRGHPFARARQGRNRLAQIVREERDALALLLRTGVLFVDVPINLQSLLMPAEAEFVWQLTARPVDFAYSGLRPLADRIGAPVARFQHIASDTTIRNAFESGRLLETYPAASLMCTATTCNGYKGQDITWDGGRWVGDILADIARALRLVAVSTMKLTDDDVDAIICALVGVLPRKAVLVGDDLVADMRSRLRKKLRRWMQALLIASRRPLGIAFYDACRKRQSLLNFAIGRPHGERPVPLNKQLPPTLHPASLRSAMWTAVDPQTVDLLYARRRILLREKHLSGCQTFDERNGAVQTTTPSDSDSRVNSWSYFPFAFLAAAMSPSLKR